MNKVNYIYEQTKEIIDKFKIKNAIIYVNEEISTLTYKHVGEITDIIYNGTNLCENACVGLYMQPNPYIPSIVHCVQKYGCSFIFLDETNDFLIKKLKLKYVFSFEDNLFQSGKESSINLNKNDTIHLYEFDVQTKDVLANINYVVQTSGTTNEQKKIVKVEHHCIAANIISLKKKLCISENDVIYFGTKLTFDPSMVELYLALTTGATLFIVSANIHSNPHTLYKTLFQNTFAKVTFIQTCPSLFLRWSKSDISDILCKSSLRILALGGEEFPNRIANCNKSSYLRVFNLYGITEVSCWASISEVIDNNEVTLGESLDDTVLEVRDSNNVRLDDGHGEMYIGSTKRICYVDEETKFDTTKPLFRATGDIIHIKDNKFYYISRKNEVIKRYGLRVNLKDVETVIYKATNIENKCVWLQKDHKLILFAKISEHDKTTQNKIIDKLRVKLLHSLKQECFPDHIALIETFPLTKHGKVDKNKLKFIGSNLPLFQHDDLLDYFKFLWATHFNLSENDVINNKKFYDLGGNSILRMQITSQLREVYGDDLPTNFYDYIFTNTFQEVCHFIKNCNMKKRKLSHCDEIDDCFKLKLKIQWRYDLQACVDCTGTILKNKSLIVIGSFSSIFVVLNINDGKLISKTMLPNAIESACCLSPCENNAYICCYDGKLYSICVQTGKINWVYKTADKIKNKPSLILQNTAVVFGSYDRHIHCVNCESGNLVWKTNVGESITSDTIYFKHTKNILVASIQGTGFCLSEVSGEIIWKIQVGCPVFGSPCVLNDNVVWPDVLGTVHAVNLHGKETWRFKSDGQIYSSLCSYMNYVIFGSHDKCIYCIQCTNKLASLKYKIALDSPINTSVSILNHRQTTYVVAATSSGWIYLINFQDGHLSSKIKLAGQIFSSPIVQDNRIFVGCRDNNLYCIELD